MVAALQILVPITISIGAVLALLHWTGKRPAPSSALVHGAFAAAVLFCMFSLLFSRELPALGIASLALLVLAGFAGVMLFILHASKRKLPKVAIVTHASLAVLGSLFLLLAIRAG